MLDAAERSPAYGDASSDGFRVLGRLGWGVLAVATALLLHSFYQYPIGWIPAAGIALLAAAAAIRPYESLLILAAFGPLATILTTVARVDQGAFRLLEMMVLAVLTGWAVRHAVRPQPLQAPFRLQAAAMLLVVAAVASGVESSARIIVEQGYATRADIVSGLIQYYPVAANPLTAAMLLAEGVLLLLATTDACAGDARRRDGIARMLVIGAAAAAAFNLLRILKDVALRDPQPLFAFGRAFAHLRVNVHHGDINAAGSFFAMTWWLSAGVAGWWRWPRAVAILLIGAGLWLAGSRVALATVFGVAALVLISRFGRQRRALAAFGVVVLLLVGAGVVWAQYPLGRHLAAPSLALRIRMVLATGAVAMAADHPVFGVGLGRFYELSERYARVPYYTVRENAHNNFLQILAELGVTGLLLFVAVIGLSLWAARQATGPPPWALVAGVCTFLLTCIGGHPLLVGHAAYPFWIALGLVAAVPGRVAPTARWPRIGAACLIIALAGTVPFRVVAAARGANVEHTSIGFSRWQRDEEGRRYRWAGPRATFFVPASAGSVRIPLRCGASGPPDVEVRIFLNGREANRVRLGRGEDWRYVRLAIRGHSDGAFARIDLEVRNPAPAAPLDGGASDEGGPIAVGRPMLD